MFDVTEEDIKNALATTKTAREKVQLKDGEEATMTIKEVKEKDGEHGSYVIVGCVFNGGDHDGKDYALFFNGNQKGKDRLFKLAKSLLTQDQLLSFRGIKKEEFIPKLAGYTIGKKFKTKAKLNEWQGKTYTNFLYYEEVVAPALQAVGAEGIPF